MSNQNRVLLHLTASPYGGIETHVYYLSLALASAGAHVTLASQRKFELNNEWTNNLLSAGVNIVVPPLIAKKIPGSAGLILSRISLSKRLPPKSFDRVVGSGHGGAFAWMKRFVCDGGLFLWNEYWYGVPTHADNYSLYRIPPPKRFSIKMRIMISQLDGIITGCDRSRRNLVEIQKIKIPIRIIPPLTRLESIPNAKNKKYDKNSNLKIVMVGRMGFGKGLGAILDIWNDFNNIGNAELHLYGPISSNFAVRMKQKYKNGKSVFFHGSFNRVDLPKILEDADIGLMLSIEEGYGLVTWEYMACGLPFIMTDCGAVEEFTKDNPDAIMVGVSLRDIQEGLEEMVNRLMNGDISRSRLQKFHKERFSYKVAVNNHLKALLGSREYWIN